LRNFIGDCCELFFSFYTARNEDNDGGNHDTNKNGINREVNPRRPGLHRILNFLGSLSSGDKFPPHRVARVQSRQWITGASIQVQVSSSYSL
jgi:hypothetical protein